MSKSEGVAVTLTESVNIPASYEKLESWILNFQEEFAILSVTLSGIMTVVVK